MREIKFRGRCGNLWFCGGIVKETIGDCVYYLIGEDYYELEEVEPETIGQYTGLQDCYGDSIYEGDILQEPQHGEAVTVEWKCSGFIAKFENGDEVALANIAKYCRVIGNIHDKEG